MTAGQGHPNSVSSPDLGVGVDFIRSTPSDTGDFNQFILEWWSKNHGSHTKTIPGHGVDLYHDLVLTHSSEAYLALVWPERDSLRTLSYHELVRSIHDLSQRWMAHPVSPGLSVAIICSKGYRRLTALLTAFRLGLVPSLVDSSGPALITSQLNLLDCDVIYAESAYHAVIPDEQKSRILKLDEIRNIPESFSMSYAYDSTVLRILSDPVDIHSRIVSLTAQHVYLNLVRDAFFILNLKKGDKIAAPSRANGAGSPFIEMAVFLSGSSIMIIDRQEWSYAAPFLLSTPFDCVCLESDAIAHLRNKISSLNDKVQWRRWYRSPLDNADQLSWSLFAIALGLNSIPRAELFWCAQAAGIGLGTIWSSNQYDSVLHPAPGLLWHLGEVLSPENPSLIPFGRFCPVLSHGDKKIFTPTDVLLSDNPDGCRYVGRYTGEEHLADYPADLVLQVLASSCSWHVILERPPESFANKPERILLAFMEVRTEGELNTIISSEIFDEAVPERVEIFNLMPPLTEDGSPDVDWCKSLYFRGELHRRNQSRIHVMLSQVKKAVFLSSNPG